MSLVDHGQRVSPTCPVGWRAGAHCAAQPQIPNKAQKHCQRRSSCTWAHLKTGSGGNTRNRQLALGLAQWSNRSHADWRSGTFGIRCNKMCCFFLTQRRPSSQKHAKLNAGRRPTTLPAWMPHHLCDTMSRIAPTVPPTKLQKRPRMLWSTCGSSGAPTRDFPCFGKRQLPEHVDCFVAPPASSFESHHHQSAPVGRSRFKISGFLVSASL